MSTLPPSVSSGMQDFSGTSIDGQPAGTMSVINCYRDGGRSAERTRRRAKPSSGLSRGGANGTRLQCPGSGSGYRRQTDLRGRAFAALGTNGSFRKVHRSMQSVTPTAALGRERQSEFLDSIYVHDRYPAIRLKSWRRERQFRRIRCHRRNFVQLSIS